ncbi:MAG: hypothetical protein KDB68_07455 [Planctomycetes bacterium]|nr:hypothetical protein [Planctomycetota bacterium]
MSQLQRRIRAFRLHLMLRLAGYAALIGLVVALVVVIAAPWLRDQFGLPGYWLTLSLPVIFPALYVAYALINRPDARTIVMAADAWCGGEGSIISAYEIEQEHPDSPFVKPLVEKALVRLERHNLPEPRLLRKMLVAMIVLLGLVPLSRYVHAQMAESEKQKEAEEQAKKVDAPPAEAEKLAEDAGKTADLAEDLGARQQERLAEDVEQAARKAQAGGQDKERALRDANSLVDRAKAQTEAQERRESAREALKNNEVTRDLAEAIDKVDATETREAIEKLTEDVFRPDGTIDETAADELRKAVEEAAKAAPQDPGLRRAADAIQEKLSKKTQGAAKENAKQARERMQKEGLSEEEINAALELLQQTDKRALERALEELSKSSSPLRDMDLNNQEIERMMKQLEGKQISPEEAKAMAEAAKQLSERLELDAESLREMLKKGREFEGLEETAKKMVEGMQPGEMPEGPQEVPEWAKDAVPEDWKQAWEEAANEQSRQGEGSREGSGKAEGKGDGEGSQDGEGEGGSGKTDPKNGKSPDIEGGKEEGVDTSDTGEGEKDPDKNPETLDPKKAAEEKAWREKTGNSSNSSGINTRDEEERLPRRYREAARKYFER